MIKATAALLAWATLGCMGLAFTFAAIVDVQCFAWLIAAPITYLIATYLHED